LTSWGRLAAEAAARLGSDHDARRIVEAASGRSGTALTLAWDEPATSTGRAAAAAMVARRLTGEPLQYVVRSWGFRTLDLMVDARVLIPRPETEVVVDHALAELGRLATGGRRPVVVDLGTGSGAIALALATEGPAADIWATDASGPALEVASANLAGVDHRSAAKVRLAQGSWYDALPAGLRGRVDLIVSNPPYVSEGDEVEDQVAAWEPAEALFCGEGGLQASAAILTGAPAWLRRPGVVVLELAAPRAEATRALALRSGFGPAEVHPDPSGLDRVLVARLPCP